MPIDIARLGSLLQQVLSGSISESEAVKLVQMSRAICQSYLEHSYRAVINVAVQQGLTITDLALDCIAEAFARDDNDRLYRLQAFTHSLRVEIERLPASEIFIAYRTVLIRIAKAHLARQYALADPAGARIHRNIREHLKHSDTLSLVSDYRGLLVRPSSGDTLEHLGPFPFDELQRLFLERARTRQTIPELLHDLAIVLMEQSRYRRSIPLMEIVLIVKKVYLEEGEATTADASQIQLDGLQGLEIDELRVQVETVLKEKILLTYFARGKVDRKQAEAMAEAIHDLLWDWCFSSDKQKSLQQYLGRHLEADDNLYEEVFRTKMEYLLRTAREEFAARLMKEL